jgi:hypothetical protein
MIDEKQRPTANMLHSSPHPYALHVLVRYRRVPQRRRH